MASGGAGRLKHVDGASGDFSLSRPFTWLFGFFSQGFLTSFSARIDGFRFERDWVRGCRRCWPPRTHRGAGAGRKLPSLRLWSGILAYLHTWNCFPQSSQLRKRIHWFILEAFIQGLVYSWTRFLQVQALFRYFYGGDSHQVVCRRIYIQ